MKNQSQSPEQPKGKNALACTIHPGEKYFSICSKNNCQEQRAIYCQLCLTDIQPEHLRYQVYVDHVLNSESACIHNWPNKDYQFDHIVQFIKQNHFEDSDLNYIHETFKQI